MIDAEKIGLARELFTEDGYCHLNHGPDDYNKVKAVDYLTIPMGVAAVDGIMRSENELVLPVCEQCSDGLTDPKWLLILCLNCISSQWIYKPESKLSYINKDLEHPYQGIILNGCPKCTKKFNGIWFII